MNVSTSAEFKHGRVFFLTTHATGVVRDSVSVKKSKGGDQREISHGGKIIEFIDC